MTRIPRMILQDPHFAKFKECYPEAPQFKAKGQPEGKSPSDWYAGRPDGKSGPDDLVLPTSVNRVDLIGMQSDPTIGTLELCIAILAWGNMRSSNRDHLFRRPVDHWLEVSGRVRAGDLSRAAAFDAFAALAHVPDAMVGMKPAYFTKLIYFLMPRDKLHPIGYIMDQWLGCSMNLLAGRTVVKMDHTLSWQKRERGRNTGLRQDVSSQVSNWNSGEDFEAFCAAVEEISAQMGSGWSPEQAELALLSQGGGTLAPWRAYVVEQRLASFGCAPAQSFDPATGSES